MTDSNKPTAYDVEGHFDWETPRYDFLVNLLPGYNDTIGELIQAIPQGRDGLDIGTGTGILAFAMAKKGYRDIHAFDVSGRMIRKCLEKAERLGVKGIDFRKADMLALPYQDSMFDSAVSGYVFHHLTDDAKRTAILEARRVLRPGGSLLIGDYMRDDEDEVVRMGVLARLGRAAVLLLEGDLFKKEFPISPDEYADMMDVCGYKDIDVKRIAKVNDAIISGKKA